MHLEHLQVEQFRCIRQFSAPMSPGRILIVGNNARGKTSLLEAIFYLVTGRSFRTRDDAECVPWALPAGESSLIRGRIRRAGGDSCRLAVTLTADSKTVRIDDQPLERLAGLWGRLRAVLFTPDDLQLVKGGPSNRRRYLDIGLSQISADYLFHLQRYSHALRQRNALLRRFAGVLGAGKAASGTNGTSRDARAASLASLRPEMEPWDVQLAEHGASIFEARVQFLQALEPRAAGFHGRIAGADADAKAEQLSLNYVSVLRAGETARADATDPSASNPRERLLSLLRDGLEDDLRRGQTERGPHRDDFVVSLGGNPARDFGSQGQVRSCVMALRLAEMAEMEARTGDSPILLLDDLASELDPSRKERVLALLDPRWQTFMTTTHPEDFSAGASFETIIQLPGR